MTPADRRRAAAKKRRQREREGNGAKCLQITTRDYNGLIDTLYSLGWLAEDQSEDWAKVCEASGALLDDLVTWKCKTSPRWTPNVTPPWHDSGHE